MIHGKKSSNNDIVFISLVKHDCPHCKNRLKTIKVTKIVNSNSPEAKEYDFNFSRGPRNLVVTGDVKFTWKEFQCKKCNKNFTVQEIRNIEEMHNDKSCEKAENFWNSVLSAFFVLIIILVIATVFIVSKYVK